MPDNDFKVDPALRTQIILAGVNATPAMEDKDAWTAAVAENVTDIAVMVGDRSPMTRLVENIAGAKVFRATMLNVVKESSSKRGLVFFYTKPGTYAKLGIESARTDFMDVKGSPGHKMAVALRDLIGHQITLWIYMEQPTNGGNPVRMIATFKDEGPVSEEQMTEATEAYTKFQASQ